jgi:hypothetical protein
MTWQRVLALIAGGLTVLVLIGAGEAVFLTVAVLLLAIILVA